MANNYSEWTEKALDEYEGDLVRAVANAQKHLDDFRAIRQSKKPVRPAADEKKKGAAA